MTYFSPNYVKRRTNAGSGGGSSPSEIIDIVKNNLGVPLMEPIMAEGELALTIEGDLLMAQAGVVPLVDLP